ncbi:MAG TPA: c-type cytochrome [Pirellulaceae bacterium]|nr:c-type cytochrome [Pirellulaceae bacterium]
MVLSIFLVFGAAAAGQEGKWFTQQPEVMPTVPAGRPAADGALAYGPSARGPWRRGPAANWIWGRKDLDRYYLRTSFAVPAGLKAARLRITCDNRFVALLNGKEIARGDDWNSPVEVDFTAAAKAGQNELLVEATNEGSAAGLIAKILLTKADDTIEYVVTDDTWQAAEAKDAQTWEKARRIAAAGGGPWGDVFNRAAGGAGSASPSFQLLPGFQVERLFTVPKNELGSWVAITTDNKGRLIASDQERQGLCRITPPPIGSSEPTKVERLDVKITAAQGLLYAFDALYVSVNGGPGSGLYRCKDTNGDDQFDEVVKLKDIRGGGEHGPHALRLAPDGKSIFLCAGNHTQPPFDVQRNSPPQTMGGVRQTILQAELPTGARSLLAPNWDEDLLLPRQWDSNGHAAGILAPGGWVAKTDPDGKTWEMFTVGYRNHYDFAFNADGEMFCYDSDMEWDMGTPWYVPTRVVHATSASEFGWRSGTGRWPAYYVDSLPPLVDVGPGSPVGVEFGYGTKFPAKYQRALYICDWTFATMYAIHMEPAGASYKATKEEFVTRTPLPLTDAAVGKDGALYFTIGGRGAQSELFRVTYVGSESTAPVDGKDTAGADLRELRREIERFHDPAFGADRPAESNDYLVSHLGHPDRHIRYAARIALERRSGWSDKALAATDANAVIEAAVGLARSARSKDAQQRLLAALGRLDFAKLAAQQQLDLLRAYQLALIRLGDVDDATRQQLAVRFAALFPQPGDEANRELAILLVYLQAPDAAKKIVPLLSKQHAPVTETPTEVLARNQGYGRSIASMLANQPDLQQIHYAFTIRNLKAGWTPDLRKDYFQWFTKAHGWSGGNSFQKFLTNIDSDAFANCTDVERLTLEALGARQPYVPPPLPKAAGPGHAWTIEEVIKLGSEQLSGRSFRQGQRAFAAARCIVCHRFAGDGGATGPDLTQLAGRFNLKDLTDALLDPSKVISDQYKASVIRKQNGEVITGRIVSDLPDAITVLVNPEDASKTVKIAKSEIEQQAPSATSLMPKDLLSPLNEQEVLDLLAYLLSRGNPQDPMFRRGN